MGNRKRPSPCVRRRPKSGHMEGKSRVYLSDDDYASVLGNAQNLRAYTHPVKRLPRKLVGRDEQLLSLRAALARAELCNVILLGEAGVGKTALVQGAMQADSRNVYLEVDLSAMIADTNNPDEMGDKLKALFREVESLSSRLSATDGGPDGIVLFMDEFHQIVELSSAAVEAMKPILADSGTRGVRVIAATTLAEFRRFVAPNQPLMERLQRLDVPELDHDQVVGVLRNIAQTYDVAYDIPDERLYDTIYEYSQRYVPSSAQPRKSIMMLDAMVGWHRVTGAKLDSRLLAHVIEEQTGNKVDLAVDATSIKSKLDKRVLAQQYATSVVEQRLQLSVAGLNDPTRPQASFLLCGSTGSGKAVSDETPVPVLGKGSVRVRRHGELREGDVVFDRLGRPTRVVRTFRRHDIQMYRVTLDDGRHLDVGEDHLWSVWDGDDGVGDPTRLVTLETQDLLARGVRADDGEIRYRIPGNGPVAWPDAKLPLDPYALGVLLAAGVPHEGQLAIDGRIEPAVAMDVRSALGDVTCRRDDAWTFARADGKAVTLSDALRGCDLGAELGCARVPADYRTASIGQRTALVQGIFDATGHVSVFDGSVVCCCTVSEALAEDVRWVLRSLGVAASIVPYANGVRVVVAKAPLDGESSLMRNSVERASLAMLQALCPTLFDDEDPTVGIATIEPLGREDCTCIYVDNDEHLYQAGDFVVTHNTELVKQVSNLLFGDAQSHLLRMDMSEYSRPDSVERFRRELTNRIWARPFSVVLLDEIEKASGEVTRVLLQVLDDGRLTDENGRVVPFVNCYIFMTTNAGSEIYRKIGSYEESDTGDGSFIGRYDRLIREALVSESGNKFPPELLGRIDAVVPFQPLSKETMRRICKIHLKELRDELLRKHGVSCDFKKDVITFLVDESSVRDSDAGGARQVMAKLNAEVTCAVARFINAHPTVKDIVVWIDGKMAVEDKFTLEGTARVRVSSRA